MSSKEATLYSAADRAFERELLAAGRADSLESQATEAAWAKFASGLGTVASAAAVAQLSSAAVPGAVAGGVTARGHWLLRLAAAKWLLVGGLVGSALTLAWQGHRSSSGDGTVTSRPAALAVVSPVAEQRAATPPLGAASATASDQHDPNGAASNGRKVAVEAKKPPGSSLAEEVAALDAVRTAANIGAWNDAQRLLGKYRERFPNGALNAEAEVLAIEALVGAGRSAEAQRSAQRFLSRRPNDPQATRVRSLVGKETQARGE